MMKQRNILPYKVEDDSQNDDEQQPDNDRDNDDPKWNGLRFGDRWSYRENSNLDLNTQKKIKPEKDALHAQHDNLCSEN